MTLLIFYQLDLSISEREVVKGPAVIGDSSVSLCSSVLSHGV